jgi:hypothetical protein
MLFSHRQGFTMNNRPASQAVGRFVHRRASPYRGMTANDPRRALVRETA